MASNNPFLYLELPREEPLKKSFDIRTSDFGEIYEEAVTDRAANQADRCIACGNPYCEWKCPVHNYIPNWLDLLSENRIFEAADLCHETNALPEVCGRICPQDRLCEGACTLDEKFGAVTIGQAEKYIVDTALRQGWMPNLSQVQQTPYSVGIIGGGPAGIACADRLVRMGIKARIYDRYPELGGLLTFGIPEFKLEKEVVARRRVVLEEMGIEFVLNTAVGIDISVSELMEKHDALFLGTGAENPRKASIPGMEGKGVYSALPYLIANTNNLHNFGVENFPYHSLKGRRVVVLGGGDTGMDCNRTAVRQGALSVTCAYRRDEESMPGSKREVHHCKEEGVDFLFNRAPVEIILEDGIVSAVKLVETKLVNEDGHMKLKYVEGSEEIREADAVVISFGFESSPPSWLDDNRIKTDMDGRILTGSKTGETNSLPGQTSNPKIFAGGDNVRGADLVVTAVADGMEAARSIQKMLLESASS